jgi:hypothetical protein
MHKYDELQKDIQNVLCVVMKYMYFTQTWNVLDHLSISCKWFCFPFMKSGFTYIYNMIKLIKSLSSCTIFLIIVATLPVCFALCKIFLQVGGFENTAAPFLKLQQKYVVKWVVLQWIVHYFKHLQHLIIRVVVQVIWYGNFYLSCFLFCLTKYRDLISCAEWNLMFLNDLFAIINSWWQPSTAVVYTPVGVSYVSPV